MTTETLTELRRLLADPLTLKLDLAMAAVNALPDLLAAAEREAKLRDFVRDYLDSASTTASLDKAAKALLADTGAA